MGGSGIASTHRPGKTPHMRPSGRESVGGGRVPRQGPGEAGGQDCDLQWMLEVLLCVVIPCLQWFQSVLVGVKSHRVDVMSDIVAVFS